MKIKKTTFVLLCCLLTVCFVALASHDAMAKPEFFAANCASCHTDDNATCDGCHHHGPQSMSATTDLTQYQPGQTVTVMFGGGTRGGWIGARLYNEYSVEVARSTGPTGTGDDGVSNPALAFPVVLTAAAPTTPGWYQWNVAWYGSPYDNGNPVAYPMVEESVPTNYFEVVGTGGGPLSAVNCMTPPNESVLASPPTFSWEAVGGTNNAFAVDLSFDYTFGSYWSTYNNLHQPIYGTSWTPSAALWSKIPSGSYVYWRVRGADTAQSPLNIITGTQVWWFYKM
jgi:hypothetical protein